MKTSWAVTENRSDSESQMECVAMYCIFNSNAGMDLVILQVNTFQKHVPVQNHGASVQRASGKMEGSVKVEIWEWKSETSVQKYLREINRKQCSPLVENKRGMQAG